MIEIENLTVSYRGGEANALSSISFRADRGEYIAIVGPNGSGKSTLIKSICGLVRQQDGTIRVLGFDVEGGRFSEQFFGRVGVVFQEPEVQFLMRDVRREIGAVLQNLGLPVEDQEERFRRLVEQFSLKDILNMKPENLSGGQMQIVNLACALASEPEILLLDEPTTFLDARYRELLMEHLKRFAESGGTIIHATQFPEEAVHAQRICVINQGEIVFDGNPEEVFADAKLLEENKLIIPYQLAFQNRFGFAITERDKWNSVCRKRGRKAPASQLFLEIDEPLPDVALSVRNLEFNYQQSAFNLTVEKLDLHRGEVAAVLGATGSGKTTLALLLAGLYRPSRGQIEFRGRPIEDYRMKELRKRLAMIWQLPDIGMIGPTVKDDLEFAPQNLNLEQYDCASILNLVGLTGFDDRIVDTLSGGEKRKLSIGSALIVNPEFMILDEPEAFLDSRSEADLIDIIRRLSEDGTGVLLIGHDLHFIAELAERVIGLQDGRLTLDLPANLFFSDEVYSKMIGLHADPMISFRHALKENGVELPFASLKPETIAGYLKEKP